MAMMVMKVTLVMTAMMVVTREILKRGKQWKQQFWGNSWDDEGNGVAIVTMWATVTRIVMV